MKVMKNITIKSIMLLLIFGCIVSIIPITSLSACDKFENSISGFPESYRACLRSLHEKYPRWTFEAMKIGIDWMSAVEKESMYDRNLVDASVSANILKSKAKGDYNSVTGKYIYKDGGFVAANEIAVSYFMDPRNSLSPSCIFQFEDLTFPENFSIELIENILYGSFMYNTQIIYLNSQGKAVITPLKYSEAILEAGEKYNIHPCLLASKILNEIGYDGSSSVSGTYPCYEGIYNFYNIGASDGSGAIGRGLGWASSGSAYSKPWNTPYKSIMGGAQYIVEQYIAEGQGTGYLQKFQVNPKSGYSLYEHQYMTNVSGACSQGYTTYLSYLASGILSEPHHFIIPVFDNMPGSNKPALELGFADTIGQTGIINRNCNIRKGPSTGTDSLGFELKAQTKVEIKSKVRTSSTHYLSVLKYPYWYEVEIIHDGKACRGYVYFAYIDETTQSVFKPGLHVFGTVKSEKDSDDYLHLLSSDASMTFVSGNKVDFKKEGNVVITAYSPCGGFERIKIKVSKSAAAPAGLKIKQVSSETLDDTLNVSWNSLKNASGYNVCIFDDDMNLIKSIFTNLESCKYSSLPAEKKIYVGVRSYNDSASIKTFDEFTITSIVPDVYATKDMPLKIDNITAIKYEAHDGGYVISWAKVAGANGYEIDLYADGIKSFASVLETSNNSYSVFGMDKNETHFYRIRAWANTSKAKIYSSYITVTVVAG